MRSRHSGRTGFAISMKGESSSPSKISRARSASTLGEHDRRERAERLAVLYPAVENILHVGLTRVGEQAAIAERPGPELRAALKPADDALLGQQFRGVAADIVAAHRRGLDTDQKFPGGVLDVALGVRFADIG